MVKSPYKVCAFCGQTGGGELGGLRNTGDKSILAHYNCLIFSPLVFTKDTEDEPEFDIPSVRAEIKRGKSLKCSYCKQHGATIGCEVKKCQKTYHYECVEKDRGIRDDGQYLVYCSKHVPEEKTDSDSSQETERSTTRGRPSTSKKSEIAKCSYCKRTGATIGCIIETCRKKYHVSCVEKDEGVLDVIGDDQHVAYCFKHAEKDSDAPEEMFYTLPESDRSESPESPSTSYTIPGKRNRKSTPGKYSSPRAKKNAEEDPEWFGASTSGPRSSGKRTRTSTPGKYSSPRAKKRNAELDTESSGSSERPSTSYGSRQSRTKNRDSGVYSPRLSNKKRSPPQEVERSRSSSSSSSPEETPVRKMKRNSNPRQIFKQNKKRTKTGDNLEDQQTAANEANLETTVSASPVKPKARRGRPPSKKEIQEAASSPKKRITVASEDIQQSDGDVEIEEINAQAGEEERKESEEMDEQAGEKERDEMDAQTNGEETIEDEQTATNEASNEANLETTVSASPVKPKARRGRPPSKKKIQEAASSPKKRITFTSVDSEDIQQSDGDAEREEMNAQAREEERDAMDAQTNGDETIEVIVQTSREEIEEVDAQNSVEEIEEVDVQNSVEEIEEVDLQTSREEIEEVGAQNSVEEIEEVGAQTSGEEIEEVAVQASGVQRKKVNARASGVQRIKVNARASGVQRKKVDAKARNADREEINAEVESNKERTTPLSQQMLNDICIPSTSQAHFDINEVYFTKLYESQCKIANSIESGVSEFRNFAQQFQTLFKQFLDICQSLNHGICSNLTNAHEQHTLAEVHHSQDATPDPLPLSNDNSHIPASTHDSVNDADTIIETLSPENTPTSVAKKPARKTRSSLSARKKRR